MKSKKLYQIVLFVLDGDGNVTEIEKPEWVVETSKDRVKARVLADKLDEGSGWNVAILQEKDLQRVNFQ